jgi:hypothetical protein
MADPRWTSAPPVAGPAAPMTAASAVPVEGSETSPLADMLVNPAFVDCSLCHGTGVMAWMQMCPDGVLRPAEHPCIRDGHAPGWHRSVDTEDRVVDAAQD